jgi:hypothetical protein
MVHHALMRGYSVDLRKKIVDAVRRRRPKAGVFEEQSSNHHSGTAYKGGKTG